MGSSAHPRKKSVLVVEDDDVLRGALQATLGQCPAFRVIAVESALEARELVVAGQADCVITDINMPEMSGVELLRHIKHTVPNLPVIMMTGFREYADSADLRALKPSGFLMKPLHKDDVISLVERLLQASTGGLPPGIDAETFFCKLDVDAFASGGEAGGDLHVRVSEARYVKIAGKGEQLPVERVWVLKAKGVTHLYMRRDEFRDCLGLRVDQPVACEAKDGFLRHTSELLLRHARLQGVDERAFGAAKNVVETAISLLADDQDVFEQLAALARQPNLRYIHAVAVSLHAALIARALGWMPLAGVYGVAIAGLMRNVGPDEAPGLLRKPRAKTTPAELTAPMSKVVAVAELLCSLAVRKPRSSVLSPLDALLRMQRASPGKVESECLAALARLFELA
ncbi:MAG: response regulator [Deltaproteobacteria bacterium]|nr:response regulator [Deltaproteobacteria bacterium]